MNSISTTETYIPTRWLFPLRGIWMMVAAGLFFVFFAGLTPRFVELARVCQAGACAVLALSSDEAQILMDWGFSLPAYAAFIITMDLVVFCLFCGVALLIFWGRSDTWVGYLVSLAFLFIGTIFFTDEARSLERLYPQYEPVLQWLVVPTVVLFILIWFVFPNGRFTPPWMGWIAAGLFAVVILDGFLIRTALRGPSTSFVILITALLGATAGVISQVYRFRFISNRIQRQQTKWVTLGFVSMFAMAVFWTLFFELFPAAHSQTRLLLNLTMLIQTFFISLFPISVLISISRYRLWEIDLIIRRTLQYSLVTSVLALTYFGGVTVLQNLFSFITGQQSPLAVVISTLTIAALFNPLRRRLQAFIDRRFYRQRYNADLALAQFAATARLHTDPERLAAALAGVAQHTLQPAQISLWLRPAETTRRRVQR